MDARSYYLSLHGYTHDLNPNTTPGQILATPPEYIRVVPPGHNSIAWLIWHCIRGEDWAVNAMLRGGEEVLARDGWNPRLGLTRLDFGAGMTEAEVLELSTAIDLDALRGYHLAVTEETRRFVADLDFDRLDDPFDAKARLAQIPETIAPGGELVRSLVESKTTKRWFLSMMTLTDWLLHYGEAEHIYRLLIPGKRY